MLNVERVVYIYLKLYILCDICDVTFLTAPHPSRHISSNLWHHKSSHIITSVTSQVFNPPPPYLREVIYGRPVIYYRLYYKLYLQNMEISFISFLWRVPPLCVYNDGNKWLYLHSYKSWRRLYVYIKQMWRIKWTYVHTAIFFQYILENYTVHVLTIVCVSTIPSLPGWPKIE